ncbi:uncharacterized protein TNCV_361871 [Trichonephila clavipes]|nr:uncharacterized protein TNCV_361871 [Trichonephila clavipes]
MGINSWETVMTDRKTEGGSASQPWPAKGCSVYEEEAHVTTLEEDLKQQPLCQDSPKDVISDSGLEIELAIPFVPNRDPPDTPQQSELREVVHYHPSE